MTLVAVLRELWRLRLVVGLVALVSVLAGLMVAFELPGLESRRYEVGIATARILVDTPSSQVVQVAPKGSEVLAVRANVIANLMVEGVVKASISERAGLRPDELDGVAESSGEPAASTADSRPDPRGNILTTRVVGSADGDLPIIEIEAQSAEPDRAVGLARAAVDGLVAFLDSKAAQEQVPDAQRLRVTSWGAPQAGTVVRGPGPLMAVAATIFLFVLGCAAILGFFGLVRGWRVAAAEEHFARAPQDLVVLDGFFDVDDDTDEPAPRDRRPQITDGGEAGRSPWAPPDASDGEVRKTA